MAGIPVLSLIDASCVGLAGRFGLEMPVKALSVVRSVKSNGLDLPTCEALWAGEISSSRSVRRLLELALLDVVAGGMEFTCFRFERRDGVSTVSEFPSLSQYSGIVWRQQPAVFSLERKTCDHPRRRHQTYSHEAESA
jgi:hypothetical protein